MRSLIILLTVFLLYFTTAAQAYIQNISLVNGCPAEDVNFPWTDGYKWDTNKETTAWVLGVSGVPGGSLYNKPDKTIDYMQLLPGNYCLFAANNDLTVGHSSFYLPKDYLKLTVTMSDNTRYESIFQKPTGTNLLWTRFSGSEFLSLSWLTPPSDNVGVNENISSDSYLDISLFSNIGPDVATTATPIPAALPLLGSGLAVLAIWRRRMGGKK